MSLPPMRLFKAALKAAGSAGVQAVALVLVAGAVASVERRRRVQWL